jgi:protoporphyrin/coproporphyrin ferrochelatase
MTDNTGPVGVLLVNVGTPDSTDLGDIRRYLHEFMSDPRVIDRSGLWWRFLLKRVIVPRRAPVSARAYAAIWNGERNESPLRTVTRAQAQGVQARLGPPERVLVGWAMRYGGPSIATGIARLRAAGCDRLLVAPLYPQYSGATTETVLDKLREVMDALAKLPDLRILAPYHDDPRYIAALAAGIRAHVAGLTWHPQALVLSFHGLPQAHIDRGDPYRSHCENTAERLRTTLGDQFAQMPLVFQSRSRRMVWTGPELEKTLADLAHSGTNRVCVVTPGFASDCLETVEEVGIRAARHFRDNGGQDYSRVPCLNDTPTALDLIAAMVADKIVEF